MKFINIILNEKSKSIYSMLLLFRKSLKVIKIKENFVFINEKIIFIRFVFLLEIVKNVYKIYEIIVLRY